jgi:hypothetical protein
LYGIAPALLAFQSLGFKEAMQGLGSALAVPPASIALAPFHLLLDPLYVTSIEAWAGAFALLTGVVLLHLVWVPGMNVDFEELAATDTANLAKQIATMTAARSGAGVVLKAGNVKRTRVPLAPLGNPAVAIVWKNTLAFSRVGTIRTTFSMVGVLVVMTQGIVLFSDDSLDAAFARPLRVLRLPMAHDGPPDRPE